LSFTVIVADLLEIDRCEVVTLGFGECLGSRDARTPQTTFQRRSLTLMNGGRKSGISCFAFRFDLASRQVVGDFGEGNVSCLTR
jgi:hypothetical protein